MPRGCSGRTWRFYDRVPPFLEIFRAVIEAHDILADCNIEVRQVTHQRLEAIKSLVPTRSTTIAPDEADKIAEQIVAILPKEEQRPYLKGVIRIRIKNRNCRKFR